ncbi:hypothetical protein L3Q82_003936 [Scortum barcoo]|uniref:Uncharacterized protein n=1 Tax=Scortum barcoo TaxID=214431 RepID=A0ACB8X6L0_9TELE|nr:hypothetical protein L3Q82_003936 [Scortum barcoo]
MSHREKARGRPRTRLRDCLSAGLGTPGIPLEELEEVSGVREVWASLLRLLPPRPGRKMICRILLLITLTSCVCGTFVVNVTQSSYQAEENQNITLEWTFTIKKEMPLTSLYILCELFSDPNAPTLFHLHEGVEVPESQDEHGLQDESSLTKTSSEKDESDFMCPDSGLMTRACTCVK